MLIKEIRDLFLSTYDIQSQIRGIPKIKIVDKMLSSFISQAQQDIQRRLLVVESYTAITLGTTSVVYNLPTNFGQHKNAIVGSETLIEKSSQFIREQIALGSGGNWFGIYQSGNTQQLITPMTSGTLNLYYYPDFRYYQPSVSSSQDWGTFSGIVYTGKLMLPDRYDMAVLYYMLAQVMQDYWALYEKEIRSLRGSRVSSMDSGFGYDLGGVMEDNIDQGAISTITTTVIAGAGGADKQVRFRVNDIGGTSTEYATGWTSDPTIVNSVSSVVITSSGSEFTNYIHVMPNQAWSWSQDSNSQITLTPSPSSGWGDAEIIVEVWN